MVARRSLTNWKLLSTVVIGVLLASAIMAGTVIYFNALRELALTSAINRLTVNETNLIIKTDRGPTTREEAAKVIQVLDREVGRRVGWMLRDQIAGVKTSTFFLTEPGNEAVAGTDNSRGYVGHLPRLYDHVTILPGGRKPGDVAVNAPGEPMMLEALAPADAAAAYNVGVNDTLSIVPYWSDYATHATVIITGLYQRNDPDNEFWHLIDRVFNGSTSGSFRTVPFMVTEEAYFGVLGATFRNMDSTYGRLLMVDSGTLNADNSTLARFSIDSLDDQLAANLFSYRQITSLADALEDYDKRLFFSKIPMFVIMILISVVILYYVLTLSSMVVEQQRGEIVLLRSRGASSVQVLAVFAMEGLTIALLATIIAPFLAAGVIGLLGFTPAFSELSGNSILSVSLTSGAFLMSGVGGVLSFAALLIPAYQTSKLSVTSHRQESARPTSQPFYQRFYLDILLLVIGILLSRQLSSQGSVVAVGVFGDVAVDQLLLAVPAINLVAWALLLLRMFPLVMRFASWLLSPILPAGLAIGIWQMARNPTHYARLSLLLLLTAGLGIFAASFGGTLQRSFTERAMYATGSDIRVSGVLINNNGESKPIVASYEALPAVQTVAANFRGFGSDLSRLLGDSYTMFAVDSDKVMDLGWFRDDFSTAPMAEMVTSLGNPTPPLALTLPENSDTIGVILRSDRPHPSVTVAARIKDGNGRYFTYILGNLVSNGWLELEAPFLRPDRFRNQIALQPVSPLALVSLTVHETIGRNRLRSGSISVDEIYVRTNGNFEVIESFGSVDDWNVLTTVPESVSDVLQPGNLDDKSAATFIWVEGSPLVSRGIFRGPPMVPLPVLASKSFLIDNEHKLDETIEVSVQGHRIDVTLVGEFEYFPTLDTINKNFSKSFLIGDFESISAYANLDANSGELKPNEIWLSVDPNTNGVERAELVSILAEDLPFVSRDIHDRVEVLESSLVDPLVEAGWNALLFVAFAAVFILSGLGFLVHAYVSFKGREVQFALMRTIGFTMKQLITLVFLEQVLVIGLGLALGTWMGRQLGVTMMPFLSHNDQGIQVLPPFAIEVNWATLGITYAAMAGLFAIIIFGVILFVRRISLQRILRLGEM
jgi:ABC-type lipoprotein release transport system permease subunit